MREVVVTYADADEPAAALVIRKLEALGYQITREEARPRPARRAAEKASTAPVLLLWSRALAKSIVAPKRALATVRLDATLPPPMIKALAIDLRAWRGREDHRGWRKLKTALAPKATAKAVAAKTAPLSPPKDRPTMTEFKPQTITPSTKSKRIDALIFIAFLAIAGGGAYYALFLR